MKLQIINISDLPRIWMIILTILFAISYDWICGYYLYPTWGYLGIEYNKMTECSYISYILTSVFPIFFFNGFTNISSGLTMLIYILGFIPCLDALYTCNPIPTYLFLSYLFSLEICMICFFATDRIYLFTNLITLKKNFINTKKLQIITIICILICIATYSSSLKFVNIFTAGSELYDLRSEVREVEVNPIINYLLLWSTNVFLPILLVVFLRTKKYFKVALVILGYFLIFMIDKQKITFFLPFVMILIYFPFKGNRIIIGKYLYIIFIISLLLVSNLLVLSSQGSKILFTLTSFFIMRTLCVGGSQFSLYLHFFETHPYTYFSHIGIVNKFLGSYPYNDSLGKIVTYGESNANAIFLVMDGISSCGSIGVIIISIVFIILKSTINTLSLKYDKCLMLIILIPIISGLLNKSLFTVFISNGIFLLIIILSYGNFPMLTKKHI